MNNLHQVLLELTRACNLKCFHCYTSKDTTGELTSNEWNEAINKLCSMGIGNCVLLGGSPELAPNFYDILQHCIDSFNEVTVESNGTLHTHFEDYKCNVSISFEYGNPEKNDAIRGNYNTRLAPDEVIEEVREEHGNDYEFIEKYGIKKDYGVFQLAYGKLKKIKNTKICRFSLYADSDIKLNIVLAEENNANSVFVPLIPIGNASNMLNKVPTSTKLLEFYDECYTAKEHLHMSHEIQHPQYFIYKLLRKTEEERGNEKISNELMDLINTEKICLNRGRVCGAGISRLFVSSTGFISPCPFLSKFNLGHILRDDLKTIHSNIDKFNKFIREYPKSTKCMKCEFVTFCGGGCIATYIKNYNNMGKGCPIHSLINKGME